MYHIDFPDIDITLTFLRFDLLGCWLENYLSKGETISWSFVNLHL